MSIKYDNNSILIIGNGESIINYEIGNQINKFKNIVRINNFKINGYEKFIGKKTTIWFNGANQGLKKRSEFPDKIIVSIPSEILSKKENISSVIYKRINNNKYSLISLEKISSYEKEVGYSRLTTGMYSILWAKDNFTNVYIHGFDFFMNSKGHYFDNKIISILKNKNILKKGSKHKLELEKQFCSELISKSKIYLLNKEIK